MGAVPGFDQAHKVGTFALQGEDPDVLGVIVSPERGGKKHPIPPVVLFPSSDIPLSSWRMPASESGFSKTDSFRDKGPRPGPPGAGATHYERLLVDVVHVQGDQVLPAAQVQPPLVLVHQEDAIVAGVEGETEGSRCFCVRQLCEDKRLLSPGGLKQQRGQRSDLFFLCFGSVSADLDPLLPVPRTTAVSLALFKMCVTD